MSAAINEIMGTGSYTFTSDVFLVWLLLIMTPFIQALDWHTYGTDCWQQKINY